MLIRFSSDRSMRIQVARSGMSWSIPSSFSVAIENTSSFVSGEA